MGIESFIIRGFRDVPLAWCICESKKDAKALFVSRFGKVSGLKATYLSGMSPKESRPKINITPKQWRNL